MNRPDQDSGAGPHPLHGTALALVTLALSLGTFMQVLDTSIANVSIPTIAGDLGVSPEDGAWIITSFAVSNAIALPLTGWLARRIGEVRLFVASVALFTLVSAFCGLASSFPMLLFFRIIQGAVGGPMIPLSQSLLLASYPPERKGVALALWSMTVVVAPVVGPILGGTITDHATWPWIFFINIPVGVFSALMCWAVLRKRETTITRQPIDLVGLVLLVVGVGSLQVMLDRGNDLDWFSSRRIIALGLLAAISLVYMVIWELYEEHPVVDLRLFARRNFWVGTVATSLGYLAFFGSVVVFPLWLQLDLHYTAQWAGFAAAPIGILAVALSPFIGRNLHRIDPRLLTTLSFIVFAGVSFWTAQFPIDTSFWQLIPPRLVQGIGIATFFVPLVSITLSQLPPDQVASAAGLSNFMRLLAGSFGTSLSITLWDRRTTFHEARLAEHLSITNPLYTAYVHALRALGVSHTGALAHAASLVRQQSLLLAANDVFFASGWLFLALIALLWWARPPFHVGASAVAAD